MTSVTLRSLRIEDIDWIHSACQDREIQRWTQVPRPYERSHAVDFVDGTLGEFIRWVIVSSGSNTSVGVISVHEIVDSGASIGYWLAPEHRGRGFTTAAILEVREELRTLRANGDADVESMLAHIAVANAPSRSAAERAGFRLLDIREGPAVEDLVPVPTCVYSMKV